MSPRGDKVLFAVHQEWASYPSTLILARSQKEALKSGRAYLKGRVGEDWPYRLDGRVVATPLSARDTILLMEENSLVQGSRNVRRLTDGLPVDFQIEEPERGGG